MGRTLSAVSYRQRGRLMPGRGSSLEPVVTTGPIISLRAQFSCPRPREGTHLMPTDSTSGNLSDRLVTSVSQIGSARTSPGLYRVLLRLLARGEPVAIAQLAAAAGRSTDEVQRAVAGWSDTEYD